MHAAGRLLLTHFAFFLALAGRFALWPSQRFRTARRATSLLCSGVIFFIRAGPLRFPSATAAGFFLFAMNTILNVQNKVLQHSIDILTGQ